jgi:hypothetical protein
MDRLFVTRTGRSEEPVNLWKRLVGLGRSEPQSPTGEPKSVRLPPPLDGYGDLNVREVIKTSSVEELRRMLEELPVESITIDALVAGDTRAHDRLFELCIQFSSVLANYAQIREEYPEFDLPSSVPADELLDLVLPRFVNQLQAQSGRHILPVAGQRIYSLAQDLISAGRNEEAASVLDVCQQVHTLDRGEVSFWRWACLHNIATTTERRDDLERAVQAARKIPGSRRSEVKQELEWEKKQLAG